MTQWRDEQGGRGRAEPGQPASGPARGRPRPRWLGALLGIAALAGTAGAEERGPAGSAPSVFAPSVPSRFRLPADSRWSLRPRAAPTPELPGAAFAPPGGLGALPVAGPSWGQLRDARGVDGLRLFNFWHGRSNAVSLQAGRHGEAMLQWTSHPFGPAKDERGVFERLFGRAPTDGP